MTQIINRVPIDSLVMGVIEKMNQVGSSDKADFSRHWKEQYYALGGTSESVASKGCPQAAAFGLWRLGLIENGGVPFHHLSLPEINDLYGKNAVYAVLAYQILRSKQDFNGEKMLWKEVQQRYRDELNDEPAKSEQGAVRLTRALLYLGYLA